jgi:hypothetical protein
VKYCVNNGNVSGASAVGGIVGYADRAKVLNSDNHRNITGTGNYGTGGIIGCDIYNPRLGVFIPPNGSTMDTCTNYGDVSAPRAGGILGSYVVSPGQSQPTLSRYTRYSKITVCKNFGAIKSPDGNGKCGSIYGAPISYASGDDESYVNHIVVQISGCTVGGTVEGVSAPSSTTDSAFATFISPSNCVQLLDGNVLQEVSQ